MEEIYDIRSALMQWYTENGIISSEEFDSNVLSEIRAHNLVKEVSIDNILDQTIRVVVDTDCELYYPNAELDLINWIGQLFERFLTNHVEEICKTISLNKSAQLLDFLKYNNLIIDSYVVGPVIKISL